jgi:hypothetical protein
MAERTRYENDLSGFPAVRTGDRSHFRRSSWFGLGGYPWSKAVFADYHVVADFFLALLAMDCCRRWLCA